MAMRSRRPEANPIDHAIVAGLHLRACPAAANPFRHLDATFCDRHSPGWPDVVRTFRLLSHRERRMIVRRRREYRGLVRDPRKIFDDPKYTEYGR